MLFADIVVNGKLCESNSNDFQQATPHTSTGRLHFLTRLKLSRFAEQMFGLSTYLDRSLVELLRTFAQRIGFT